MTRPLLVYYHTYLVGHYKLLIHEQLLKIFTSGLYTECQNIYIGISSHDDNNTQWILDLVKDYDKIVNFRCGFLKLLDLANRIF